MMSVYYPIKIQLRVNHGLSVFSPVWEIWRVIIFLLKLKIFGGKNFVTWCLSGKTRVLWIGSSPSSICHDSPHLLQRFQLENDRFVLSNKNQLLLKICCSSLPSSSLLKSSLLFVSAPRNKSDCKTSEPEKFFQKVFRFKTPKTCT